MKPCPKRHRVVPIALGVLVGLLGPGLRQSQAGSGGLFKFEVFRVSVSLPYVALTTNAQGAKTLVNGRLTNRQFVNLGQGRDPETPVPRNEILVVVNPNDYVYEASARFAIVDTNTKTILKNLTQVQQSVSGYGGPGGSGFFLFAKGGLLQQLTSPRFAIQVTSVSGSAKGRETVTPKGTKLTTKVGSLTGSLPLTIDGVQVPAVVLTGRVRVFGRPLFSFDGP